MNQKYIDFVPSKKTPPQAGASTPVRPSSLAQASSARSAAKPRPKTPPAKHSRSVSSQVSAEQLTPQSKSRTQSSFSIKKEPELGVIEDFRPKFVSAEVEKRPLSRGHFTSSKSEIAELKSRNIKNPVHAVPAHSSTDAQSANTAGSTSKQSLQIPKSPFIAKAKVSKRPLSKNAYSKPVQPTKEPATGPVAIITKPEEKESKGGIAIAIILTIILGAIAGTIAFLIMPK